MIINELRRTESRLITRQWLGPDTIDAGPTISLGGTRVRDPHGFTRYLYGTHSRWDPHIFLGPTILLWDP
jgi:hypothetical protein